MNKQERIAVHGTFPVSIWGNADAGDFLIHEIGQPVPRAEILRRRWPLLAVVGLVDGKPATALEEPLDDATIDALSAAYVSFVAKKLDTAFTDTWGGLA